MAGRERRLSYVVYQEDDGFVARCLDVNVASEGDTEAGSGRQPPRGAGAVLRGRGRATTSRPWRTHTSTA